MTTFVKIENATGLVRDMTSGAIINTNRVNVSIKKTNLLDSHALTKGLHVKSRSLTVLYPQSNQ